jgi:hypothetical protein
MKDPHRSGPRALSVLVILAFGLVLPVAAWAASNWGFGPGGQATARITWQTDAPSSKNRFTLAVKVKSAKSPTGVKCTVRKHHPRQIVCPVSPATSYGYIDVTAKKRIPCTSVIHYQARIHRKYVKQPDIRPGNAC